MGKKEKLLLKALNDPKNLRFSEFCTLAEQFGLKQRSKSGSHIIYKWDNKPKFSITIQSKNGMAKPYQVKQLINHLEERDMLKEKGK